jgi:hypothetical protein
MRWGRVAPSNRMMILRIGQLSCQRRNPIRFLKYPDEIKSNN